LRVSASDAEVGSSASRCRAAPGYGPGSFPEISLAAARRLAADYREGCQKGRRSIEQRRPKRKRSASRPPRA